MGLFYPVLKTSKTGVFLILEFKDTMFALKCRLTEKSEAKVVSSESMREGGEKVVVRARKWSKNSGESRESGAKEVVRARN